MMEQFTSNKQYTPSEMSQSTRRTFFYSIQIKVFTVQLADGLRWECLLLRVSEPELGLLELGARLQQQLSR